MMCSYHKRCEIMQKMNELTQTDNFITIIKNEHLNFKRFFFKDVGSNFNAFNGSLPDIEKENF